MLKFLRSLLSRPIKRLGVAVLTRLEEWSEADLPSFATQPKNLTIARPRTICCFPNRISIGDDVWLGPGSLLVPVTSFPAQPLLPSGMAASFKQVFDPKITIGNRVTSTGGLTVGAHEEIKIEDGAMSK